MQKHIIRCECNAKYRSDVARVNVYDDEGNAMGTRMRSTEPCSGCGKRDGVQETGLPTALDAAQRLATDAVAEAMTDAAVEKVIDERVEMRLARRNRFALYRKHISKRPCPTCCHPCVPSSSYNC